MVDDSLSNRKALSLIIDQTDYDVITAVDGLDALQIMNDNPVDMVFTDLEMPRMNGFEFLEQAIAEFGEEFADCVIFMLTTSLDPQDRERAGQYSMVRDYLSKPLTIDNVQSAARFLVKDV